MKEGAPATATPNVQSRHLDEVKQGTPAMFRVTLALASVGYAGLAMVDPWLASGPDLHVAFVSRGVYLAVTAALFALTFAADVMTRHGRALSMLHCLLSGHEVVLLTWLVGGGESSYHEALHIVMFGYALLPFPWKRWDAPIIFATFVLSYNLLLVFGERMGNVQVLISRNALLLVTVLVASVFQRVLMQGRLRDFLSRQALAEANERMKALDDAKSRFFANLSHELRTPLTLIVAPLEATLDSSREPLGAAQAERLQLAHRNALRLLRLVDDLLALTRAEAAALEPRLKPTDAGGLLAEIHREVEALAARKNITVTLAIENDLPEIRADRELVDRVLLNLIGNAAKFVDVDGHIELGARRTGDAVEISVRDDGAGIGPEHIAHIFDRFYQADSGSTRSVGGTGIGLALVKEIMTLHGGDVTVDSALGVGTTLRCLFPIIAPEMIDVATEGVVATPAAGRLGLPEWHEAIRSARAYRYLGIDDATDRRVAPRPRPRGDAPTVLVVEDNPDMVRFIVALMAVEYNVFAAKNGQDALRMLGERRPDLIISDVMMPGMDGFELVRRVRRNPDTRHIPFIFLTARGRVEDRVAGHAGGADTYLAKPFRSEELLAAVESLLSRQATVRAASDSREEEALVFMASGVAEMLREVRARCECLDAGAARSVDVARLKARIDETEKALSGLVVAGARPFGEPARVVDCVRAVLPGQQANGPTMHLELEISEDATVAMDSLELKEVCETLVARAIAVTPEHGIVTVHIRAAGPRAVISVRDEGPPPTTDQIEHFFFPFNGFGVDGKEGLAMLSLRRIVRARGGDVAVEALPAVGCEVRVFVPHVAPDAEVQ